MQINLLQFYMKDQNHRDLTKIKLRLKQNKMLNNILKIMFNKNNNFLSYVS